jgi:hypothetical protein
MGAILSQEGGTNDLTEEELHTQKSKPKLHPIAYYSATFTPTEQNYDIYEQELLAVMKALSHWQPYLGWTTKPFVILTDHANLQYWKASRDLNQRTARWHADLQEYNYLVKYIPGKENTLADILSRPDGANTREQDNKGVIMIPPS